MACCNSKLDACDECIVFCESLEVLLRHEAAPLLFCMAPVRYWGAVAARVVAAAGGGEERQASISRDYERLAQTWPAREACAAALAAFHLLLPERTSAELGLILGPSGDLLCGVQLQPEGGWVARQHRTAKRQLRGWLRRGTHASAAALPLAFSTLCVLTVASASAAVAVLVQGLLESYTHSLLGSNMLLQLARKGLHHGNIFTFAQQGEAWRKLRRTLGLFVLPNLLALLRQLFPSTMQQNDSTVKLLLSMAHAQLRIDDPDKALKLGTLFISHCESLAVPIDFAFDFSDVAHHPSHLLASFQRLLGATSIMGFVSALIGIQKAVTTTKNMVHFARELVQVLGNLVQAERIWEDAGLLVNHEEAARLHFTARDFRKVMEAGTMPTPEDVATSNRRLLAALAHGYSLELHSLVASCAEVRSEIEQLSVRWRKAAMRIAPAKLGRSQPSRHDLALWPSLFTLAPKRAVRLQRELASAARKGS